MTPTVTLTQGLPAAGKTTAARKLLANAVRPTRYVGLDSLRLMLDGQSPTAWWADGLEAATTRAQAALVRQLVADGSDVLVDGTHVDPEQVRPLTVALSGLDVRWAVLSVPTALEVCLARDALRTDPVGELEIRALHARLVAATAAGWVLSAGWLAGETAGVAA